ncbi:MAG: zf-HC2 domain-containing protein [Actinobacteria bacterium]|nr:zf-HC2 domain-containing protein [Actinomycetota bacterium]MCA1698130.1 zf-HC2 domain-containing protein [Actinomycetota bacterium]
MRLTRRIRDDLDHRFTRRRVFDYLDGELSERRSRRVRDHAGRCPDCGVTLRALTILLWELRELSAPEPRQSVVAGVLRRLRQAQALPRQRRYGHSSL